MPFLSLRILLPLACALAAAALAGGPARAAAPAPASAPVPVVPSLDPAGTARLWHELVTRRRPLRASDDCRPLTAVFYAATDWLRLATHLAAAAGPCAQYYVSVPPLASDHTQPRGNQAGQIRALGSSFHAVAEINYTGWSQWVASTGQGWFAAGVAARRRMAAAGYDVNAGDTWGLNELSSAVRQGLGSTRQDVEDFIRGLYTGDGGSGVRGIVFAVGVSQTGSALDAYQARLQDWLEDSSFWSAIGNYVSDFSQELYGDVRAYAVPGAAQQDRRTFLTDYLGHVLTLARAGPDTAQVARGFLEGAYSPLANAAWQYDSEFGFTTVPYDLMEDYVSSQVDALRAFDAGRQQDRFGFAWAPRNGSGLSISDLTQQTNSLLDRLAQAIRDSGQPVDPNDPGAGACGPPGQNVWCGGDLDGAAFTSAWKSLARWQPEVLTITSPPQTLQPGTPSGAITVELRTAAGRTYTVSQPLGLTLTTSSPTGGFSTSASGPFTNTLGVQIPSGGASVTFYYVDSQGGSPTLNVGATGKTSGAQTETIGPPPPPVTPDTTITGGPTGTAASATATFTFVASAGGVGFQCSVDGAAFSPCTSPATFTGLADGTHTFGVAAMDAAGNVDPTPAETTWLVDTTPPQTTIAAAPRGAVASASARFSFSADEPARFQCALDGAAFAACSSPASYLRLPDGTHTFRVRGIDLVGNVEPAPSEITWTVDTTPPQTTITAAPARLVAAHAATLWFRSNERDSRFECSLGGAPFAVCRSPLRLSALPDLRHTVRVRAIDAAGNTDPSPALAAWTSDTTPPRTAVAKAPPAVTRSRGANVWLAASERGARLQCSLDGSGLRRCASPVQLRRLKDGRHVLRVRSIDPAGNRGSFALVRWTVDATPPDTRITKAPPATTTKRGAVFWVGATERGATFQCSLDAHAFVPCRSPQRYSTLDPGKHKFRVRAVDAAGNRDATPATFSWQISRR